MIISDLNYIEVVAEESNVEGAFAFAASIAGSTAFGSRNAVALTATGTTTIRVPGAAFASAGSASLAFASL